MQIRLHALAIFVGGLMLTTGVILLACGDPLEVRNENDPVDAANPPPGADSSLFDGPGAGPDGGPVDTFCVIPQPETELLCADFESAQIDKGWSGAVTFAEGGIALDDSAWVSKGHSFRSSAPYQESLAALKRDLPSERTLIIEFAVRPDPSAEFVATDIVRLDLPEIPTNQFRLRATQQPTPSYSLDLYQNRTKIGALGTIPVNQFTGVRIEISRNGLSESWQVSAQIIGEMRQATTINISDAGSGFSFLLGADNFLVGGASMIFRFDNVRITRPLP